MRKGEGESEGALSPVQVPVRDPHHEDSRLHGLPVPLLDARALEADDLITYHISEHGKKGMSISSGMEKLISKASRRKKIVF